jgi:hypothetical protein
MSADRRADMTRARHEIGNALSIAQASIEAMLDGVVPITDQRLRRLSQILDGVSEAVYELTEDGETG